MFITNEMNPGEMLAELLKGRRVDAYDTESFIGQKHDRHLCPRFRDQAQVLLDVYKAYGQEVHDVQGPRDEGVDVLMKYVNAAGEERLAGLQIKSEDEFRDWEAGKLKLPLTLKIQYANAVNNIGVHDYYVLLCVDAVRHQKRIRILCSELKNYRPCEIIEPTSLLDLYEMSDVDLWARVTRLLCHNDRVLTAATQEMDQEEPDMAFFLITLTCQALGAEPDLIDEGLQEIWSDWREFAGEDAGPDQRIAEILANLIDGGVINDRDGQYKLIVRHLPTALCALYFDLRVRAIDRPVALRDQLVSLVELESRLGPEPDDMDEDDI